MPGICLFFPGDFHKLQRKIPDATRRVLNIQLKELEEHELISKKIYPVVSPKVGYSVTDFGKTLIPVIAMLGNWADKIRNVYARLLKTFDAKD
ncbi:winged helix-turn-helix transcriptional regulator [Pedobacter panaciterrae]